MTSCDNIKKGEIVMDLKKFTRFEIVIPKIPSVKITDIAIAINSKLKRKNIGIRLGV